MWTWRRTWNEVRLEARSAQAGCWSSSPRVIIAVNLKMFVRPAEMYPGGMNGLSMLMQTIFSTYLGLQVPFTVFNVIFNSIPVYIGLRFLGRKFTILSIITIILSSVLTDLLPDMGLTQDPLLNCVFGGILYAFGSSLCLRADAPPAARTSSPCTWPEARPRRLWHHLYFHAILLAVAGYLFGWDKAMYSIIYQFTVTQALHVFYKELPEAHAVYHHGKAGRRLRVHPHQHPPRGHALRGIGLYEQKERNMVYSVVSSSEMRRVLGEVRRVDEHAFINIIKTDVFAAASTTAPPTDGSAAGQRRWLEVDAHPPHEQGAGVLRFVPVGVGVRVDGGRPTSRGLPPAALGDGG